MTGAPYIRFDLMFEDEEQGIGFLHGLHETGLSEEMGEELSAHFNDNLKIPYYHSSWIRNDEQYPGCYFTRKGYILHEQHINRVIEAIRELDNGWDVRTIEQYDIPEDGLYYEDEEQVVMVTYHDLEELAIYA